MNDIRLRQIILCILMLSVIAPARSQSSAGSNIVSRAHKGSVPLCSSFVNYIIWRIEFKCLLLHQTKM